MSNLVPVRRANGERWIMHIEHVQTRVHIKHTKAYMHNAYSKCIQM